LATARQIAHFHKGCQNVADAGALILDIALALDAARREGAAGERERCIQIVQKRRFEGMEECPFSRPNCRVVRDEPCPVCGQDSDGNGGTCAETRWAGDLVLAIRARAPAGDATAKEGE
jgi:hypothetical protein